MQLTEVIAQHLTIYLFLFFKDQENQQSPVKPAKGKTTHPQKCRSKQSKIQQKIQHDARCDINVKQSGNPESAVKSILPKIPQRDAQTVILIPAVTPTQKPSVVSSLILTSKSSPVIDNAKILCNQKKFEGRNKEKNIIAKENGKNLSRGLRQEPEASCDVKATSKSICASEDDPKDIKLKRNKKNVSKLAIAAVSENSNTVMKNQLNKKSHCKHSDKSTKVPVEHQEQLPVPSKCTSLHSVDQLSPQQGVPHHPPPPYPQHANKETCVSLQELQMPNNQETDKTVKETMCPKAAGQKSSQIIKKLCERRHRRQLTLPECPKSVSVDMTSSENLTDTSSCSGSNTSESQVSSSHSSSQPFPSDSSKVYPSCSPHDSSTQITSKLIETPQSFPSDIVTVTSCSSPTPSTYSHTSEKAQTVLSSLLKSCSTVKDPSSDVVPSSQPALNSSSLEGAVYSPYSSNKAHNYSSIYSSSPSVHSPPGTSSSPPPDSSPPSTGFMHSPSSVCYSQYSSSYSNISTSAHAQQPISISDTPAVTSSSQSSHQMSYSYQSKPAPYTISSQSSSLTQNSQPTPCIPPLHTFYTRSSQPTLSVNSPHSTLHTHSSHPSSYNQSSRSVLYTQSHQPSYAQSPQPDSYAHSPQTTSYTQSPHPASYGQSPQTASYSQSPQPPSYTQSSYPASYTESPQAALYTQSPQSTSYTEAHQPLLYTQSPQPASYTHSHHSPSYTQSPQPDLYSHSPQPAAFIQSRHPNSHFQSKHPTAYSQSSQSLAYSIPTQRCVNDNAPHSPLNPSFSDGHIPSYCQPLQPDSYCQSPKTTPIPAEVSPNNNVVKHDSQSPILPPYSNPQISPSSSHYFASPTSVSYSSIYSSQQTNDTHDSHYYGTNKGIVIASSSYSSGEMSSSFMSLERSLSPPSYEAHLQNTASYLTSDHHLSDVHYNVSVTSQQTTPTNYSVSCHSSRLEQEDSTAHLDPRKNVRSPPAYPSSTALFPPPPPRYTSNPKITPTACHSKCAVAPDISKGSYKESAHAFFPNTPPVVPPPAAPPPVDIQSDAAHCSMQNYSTSQSQSGSHSTASSLSFPSGIYLSSQDAQCSCDDQEGLQGSHNRTCKSMDQQVLYKHYLEEMDLTLPACRTSTRGAGIHSSDNLKVHSLIERAERLWFIPHQEQNRVYMKRKELARDFLSHPS